MSYDPENYEDRDSARPTRAEDALHEVPDPMETAARIHSMGTSQLELFQALMTAIKRLEEVGGKTDDLRELANRVADPYQED